MLKHSTPVALREHAIRELASRTHRSTAEVAAVYDAQFAALEAGAKVKTYVPVLAYRRTRDALLRH